LLKRVPTSDLRIGMYIDDFCGSWMDHPFWRTRFLLKNEPELAKIRSSGVSEVWIDTSRGLDAPTGVGSADRIATDTQIDERLQKAFAPPGAPNAPPRPCAPADLQDEFHRATRILRNSRGVVAHLFGEARLGNVTSIAATHDVVDDIADSVERHPQALIGLARLKAADDYTFMHALAASALMVALARALGLADDEVREAGMAGLLHDVGKVEIPSSVLNKPDTLNDKEWQIMRSHAERGCAMLRDTPDVNEGVLDAVLHHHEKMDGSGYPHRLHGEQISRLARMTAICDVYDAVTSHRAYNPGWEPTVAVRKMAEWNGHFDEALFQCFVRTIGIYPLGSLVRLKSQRLAVVVDHDPGNLLQPIVKVFFSLKSKMHIEPSVVNLDKSQNDRIIGCEDPTTYGFRHIPELWLPPGMAA
jgi:putative nucleotidyltransferase with HDIG domain